MLIWANEHWSLLVREPGFKPTWKGPVYGDVWTVLNALDMAALERELRRWSAGLGSTKGAVSLDGKQLRGTKRSGFPALQVVTAAAQEVGSYWGRRLWKGAVAGGSLDSAAGHSTGRRSGHDECRAPAEACGGHGSGEKEACLGVLKGNHGEVTAAVNYWVDVLKAEAPSDLITHDRRHGHLKRREYWWVAADELKLYVAEALGWHGLKLCGRVRRSRRRLHQADRESQETSCWVYLGLHDSPDGAACCHWLCHHWEIENSVFWVLDVTYGEDRNHARAIGLLLSPSCDIQPSTSCAISSFPISLMAIVRLRRDPTAVWPGSITFEH